MRIQSSRIILKIILNRYRRKGKSNICTPPVRYHVFCLYGKYQYQATNSVRCKTQRIPLPDRSSNSRANRRTIGGRFFEDPPLTNTINIKFRAECSLGYRGEDSFVGNSLCNSDALEFLNIEKKLHIAETGSLPGADRVALIVRLLYTRLPARWRNSIPRRRNDITTRPAGAIKIRIFHRSACARTHVARPGEA